MNFVGEKQLFFEKIDKKYPLFPADTMNCAPKVARNVVGSEFILTENRYQIKNAPGNVDF